MLREEPGPPRVRRDPLRRATRSISQGAPEDGASEVHISIYTHIHTEREGLAPTTVKASKSQNDVFPAFQSPLRPDKLTLKVNLHSP